MFSFNRFVVAASILTVGSLFAGWSQAAEGATHQSSPVKVCKSKSVLVTTPAGEQHIVRKTVCVLTGARAR